MTIRSSSGGAAGTPIQWSSTSSGNDGKYEVVNGVQRPKWNDYTSTSWRAVRTVGKENYNGSSIDVWTNCTSFPVSDVLSANDLVTLQSRLSEAVKGHQFNLAVSAAQGKQTVNMVTSAIHSIGGAISDLRKGRFESAARRFGVSRRPSKLSKNDVAGRWLELQYGWLPLISDVYEAAKAYEAITSNRSERIQVSITRKVPWDSSGSKSNYSCKGVVQQTAGITYEMSEILSTPRSLGLTDPASVAWELIPYSFVVDWFIPIGDYLENLNVIPNLRGRFLTKKVKNFQGSMLWINPLQKWFKRPTEHVQYMNTSRTVSTSLKVNKPGFTPVPDAMSPKRIFNALALVVQRIR